MLTLEGFQAGLSWITILRKRDNFRKAFKNFNVRKVARFGKADVARLMRDAGIIRNRLKIEAAITNARRFLDVQKEYGSFDRYVWRFSGTRTCSGGFPVAAPRTRVCRLPLRPGPPRRLPLPATGHQLRAFRRRSPEDSAIGSSAPPGSHAAPPVYFNWNYSS